jgi:hypothetical protein
MDDLVSDGDRVVLRWTATGTHEGRFADVVDRDALHEQLTSREAGPFTMPGTA